jgi:hypothetical protein
MALTAAGFQVGCYLEDHLSADQVVLTVGAVAAGCDAVACRRLPACGNIVAMSHLRPPTVVIENFRPLIEGGRYPVKRAVGEDLTVEADVFKDGHDVLSTVLKWRAAGAAKWHETPMKCIDPWNKDRWRATCVFFEIGAHEVTIEAWGDTFRSWQHEFAAKFNAAEPNLTSETLEGAKFVEQAAVRAEAIGQNVDATRLREYAAQIKAGTPEQVNGLAHEHELEALMWSYADRSEATEYAIGPVDIRGAGGKPAGENRSARRGRRETGEGQSEEEARGGSAERRRSSTGGHWGPAPC